jgi:hypothetical protein
MQSLSGGHVFRCCVRLNSDFGDSLRVEYANNGRRKAVRFLSLPTKESQYQARDCTSLDSSSDGDVARLLAWLEVLPHSLLALVILQ